MKWNDFLNPRSMLTPGVAGSVVMVIANTLWIEFMIPQKWTALLLSFLFIIPILMKFSASFIENIIYFTFNGLIVFALAVNTNFAGKKLQEISTSDQKVIAQQQVEFKSPLASASSTDKNIQINQRINGLQFASNSTQGSASDASGNNQTDPSKNDNQDKKDTKEQKDKPKQEDRQFFDSWF